MSDCAEAGATAPSRARPQVSLRRFVFICFMIMVLLFVFRSGVMGCPLFAAGNGWGHPFLSSCSASSQSSSSAPVRRRVPEKSDGRARGWLRA